MTFLERCKELEEARKNPSGDKDEMWTNVEVYDELDFYEGCKKETQALVIAARDVLNCDYSTDGWKDLRQALDALDQRAAEFPKYSQT